MFIHGIEENGKIGTDPEEMRVSGQLEKREVASVRAGGSCCRGRREPGLWSSSWSCLGGAETWSNWL